MFKIPKKIIRVECVMGEDLYDKGLRTEVHPHNCPHNCPHIIKKFEGKRITRKEAEDALDLIIAYFVQNSSCVMLCDIDERDKYLTPSKEMTIKETEKELGYKVNIVDDKESD